MEDLNWLDLTLGGLAISILLSGFFLMFISMRSSGQDR